MRAVQPSCKCAGPGGRTADTTAGLGSMGRRRSSPDRLEDELVDDLKKGYREGEETTKEAWRKRDGEDLADKVGNAGDDVRKNLGNLGDDASRATRDMGRDANVDTDPDRM
jgi:hypothetical protein